MEGNDRCLSSNVFPALLLAGVSKKLLFLSKSMTVLPNFFSLPLKLFIDYILSNKKLLLEILVLSTDWQNQAYNQLRIYPENIRDLG